MKKDAKVKEYPDLIKRVGGFVVNTNSDEYQRALKRNRNSKKQRNLEARVESIESTLQEILSLLRREKDAVR